MTEVDTVMPEGVSPLSNSPAQTNAADNTETSTPSAVIELNNSNDQKLQDHQNGKDNKKENADENKSKPMEVDENDTEDCSHKTSSTENGGGSGSIDDGKVTKVVDAVLNDNDKTDIKDVDKSATSEVKDNNIVEDTSTAPLKVSVDDSQKSTEKVEKSVQPPNTITTNIKENSSNPCDNVLPENNDVPNKKSDLLSQENISNSTSLDKTDPIINKKEDEVKDENKVKDKADVDGEVIKIHDSKTTTNENSVKKETNRNSNDVQQDKKEPVVSVSDTKSETANKEDVVDVKVPNNVEKDKSVTLDDNNMAEKSVNNDDIAAKKSESIEVMDLDKSLEETPTEKGEVQKENGIASETEKSLNDSVVDLGGDSEEDSESVPKTVQKHPTDEATNNETIVKSIPQVTTETVNKIRNSICSDSDGAVVIGSDSETEAAVIITKPNTNENSQIIDDDDDDCVVIEDDAPPTTNDFSKRKNISDPTSNSDDSQPPSKRFRNAAQTPTVNQLAIKDARSLMSQDTTVKRVGDATIYPINITPATNSIVQGPPKLVPMTNTINSPLAGMPGLGTNANLLPGLTDDMFVLEAPSFIVPYIYEKPPVNNLKDIVKEIEDKYKLSKEDLADAVKSDDFDMMTEQNKEDKEEKNNKKKKKRRNGDDADESWSEESEEDDDDDDDDSESGVRTKVLIKEATDDLTAIKGAINPVVTQTATVLANKPGQENYFESPLGKFFMDIGIGQVQEFVQTDLIRLQKRKMRKSLGKNISECERAISALSGNLEASKKKNAAFKFTMKRCEFCNFKSESALAMAHHYESPHMNGPMYKCNFCVFEIRNATEIVYHMEAMHNIKARLIKPLPYHQCPNCGFEDNGKAKLARHQPVCAKKFRPELNLAPPNDWEAPAKIPRIKPRHGLVGTATAYQAMAAQAAAQKAALASIQQQQQQVAQARSLQAAALAAQNAANKIRGRPPVVTKPGPNGNAVLRSPSQVRTPMATNIVLPNNYQMPVNNQQQLMQQAAANAIAKKSLTGQPSISITPLPRQSATVQAPIPSTSKMPPAGMKPGQSPTGNKTQFVICEICDGYIKDLEQLRNHMQWMHKVKIHPKMIYNRPPLNCQKCQFRFFTDQGLERHLLGSHGLVTSSMQEAANKGKDAGRCPVCGRMYQWKLLNHVSRDHHMTLKPAHLSYKCTVCTATFGMYKQFETHVYTAHSTVAKKAMDGKKNNGSPSPTTGSPSNSGVNNNQRNNLVATNDSLLKPLKINDEITIIPQPASKPRLTNIESHVID